MEELKHEIEKAANLSGEQRFENEKRIAEVKERLRNNPKFMEALKAHTALDAMMIAQIGSQLHTLVAQHIEKWADKVLAKWIKGKTDEEAADWIKRNKVVCEVYCRTRHDETMTNSTVHLMRNRKLGIKAAYRMEYGVLVKQGATPTDPDSIRIKVIDGEIDYPSDGDLHLIKLGHKL